MSPEAILKDPWRYCWYYVKPLEDYTAYDTSGHEISREQFLTMFASGDYLPLRLRTADSSHRYRMYALPPSTDPGTRSTLGNLGKRLLHNYKQEGKPLPPFTFVDLNGNQYTPENTKGRIVVLKCWFINCSPCVAEMPQLNRMMEQYKDRKDILFISLATDPANKLQDFLQKTEFNYAVIPGMRSYMSEGLEVKGYPTHFLVNRQGQIAKVTGKADELEIALRKEAGKSSF
jgi:peroxiredoxin